MTTKQTETPKEYRFIKVAKVSDIPPGTAIGIHTENMFVALSNVDGQFYAIDDICSHLYCNLSDGWLREHTLICPCHDAAFDVRTGKNLDWRAAYPVKSFTVRVEGDDVLIGI